MKKLFLLLFALVGFAVTSNSQNISKNAIGLRLGDSDGFGTEVSYQRGLSDKNRLEFDLGWRSGNNYNGFKLAGLYQWVWEIQGGFNWYAGVGGGVGSYEYGYKNNYNLYYGPANRETFVFAAGDIGIEYNFDIPLQISLDFRPELRFGDYTDGFGSDIGLGVRYKF